MINNHISYKISDKFSTKWA